MGDRPLEQLRRGEMMANDGFQSAALVAIQVGCVGQIVDLLFTASPEVLVWWQLAS
jgi:hypothetical protein